jgi:hypothetical protein
MSYSVKGFFAVCCGRGVIVLSILVIALTACAGLQNKKVAKTEDVLFKAGFQKVSADTPEKLTHLETLPQRKMVSHQHKDGIRYIYADATLCKCIYVGDKDAYQSYKHILLEKEVKDFEHVDGGALDQGQMNWELWGDFSSTPGY